MKIFAFGSSIVSSYWNGAATYYRGCYKYLARLGYGRNLRRTGRVWAAAASGL